MYRRRAPNSNNNSVNAPFKSVFPNQSTSISGHEFSGSKAPAYIPERSNTRFSLNLPQGSSSKAPSYIPQRPASAKRSLSSASNSSDSNDITIQKVVETEVISIEDTSFTHTDQDGDIEIVSSNKVEKTKHLPNTEFRINNIVPDSTKPAISLNNPFLTSHNKKRQRTTIRPNSFQLPMPLKARGPSPESLPVVTSSVALSKANQVTDGSLKYYEVMYRKPSSKKHKTWTDDGIVKLNSGGRIALEDRRGKEIGHGSVNSDNLDEDLVLRIGGFEVQISHQIDVQKTDPDTYFLEKSVLPTNTVKTITKTSFVTPTIIATPLSGSISTGLNESLSRPVSGNSNRSGFRTYKINAPRHDPHDPNSIVMPRYPVKLLKTSDHVLDVVIDPCVGRMLRPHQIEGVKFLYECVMGFREFGGNGALLADEMGLGKTLMTITLIWTLLKQTPIAGNKPAIERALIVCPVSLMLNWKKEFKKWLGSRVGVFMADGKTNLRQLVYSRVYQVIICGYERLRSISEDLQQASIDLIVMDEGHRLKSSNNKSLQAILSFPTAKRILLTGTPIQNDLGEFFAMVDLINPGILGTYQSFKKDFEVPIIKSRQPEASSKDLEKGRLRSDELSVTTRTFTLRRTADTIEKYLPPKTESVIFCKPSAKQIELYKQILESTSLKKCVGSNNMSEHLRAITVLKKLCNSPSLLRDEDLQAFNLNLPPSLPFNGGKLRLLMLFLSILRKKTTEKVVVVSGFTKTLDVIESALNDAGMSSLRLDGSTANTKRQALVDQFNNTDQRNSFVFLLSAKSGGTGLNLIGASRLFLFDTDWNPSVDLQAMARVHRDGQKHPVFVYRLLITGAMDEKIYQRQITKQGLADSFMDSNEGGGKSKAGKKRVNGVKTLGSKQNGGGTNSFSQAELQDLFKFHTSTLCHTHDLLGCKCAKTHGNEYPESSVSDEKTDLTYDEFVISRSQGTSQGSNSSNKKSCFVISDDEDNCELLGENKPNSRFASNSKSRNDTSLKPNQDDQVIDISSDEDDNNALGDERKRFGGWTTAKNVIDGTAPVPKYLRDKAKSDMKGLYEYKHIDPAAFLKKLTAAGHNTSSSNPVVPNPPTKSRKSRLSLYGYEIDEVMHADGVVEVEDEEDIIIEDDAQIDGQLYFGDDIMLEALKSNLSPVSFIFTKSSTDKKNN